MCSAGAPSLMMINLMPEESCRRQPLAQGLKARSKLSGRQRKQPVQRPRGQRELSIVTQLHIQAGQSCGWINGKERKEGFRRDPSSFAVPGDYFGLEWGMGSHSGV